jgi:hypothetical protein
VSKINPQLATLLARQRGYTRSAEITSISTDVLSILMDASGITSSPDTLWGLATSTHIFAPVLATCSGGRTSKRHSFILALATRSGAASHSGIYSPRCLQHARGLCLELTLFCPSVDNTLGGYASNRHSFTPTLVTRSVATLNARILVVIYQFGCRMSDMKVSPRLATPDGPVFVSSALCQEIFHTYSIKFCINGHIEWLTLNWASTW